MDAERAGSFAPGQQDCEHPGREDKSEDQLPAPSRYPPDTESLKRSMIDESDRQRHSEQGRDEQRNFVERKKPEFVVNDIWTSVYDDGESKVRRQKEDQEERDVNREFPSGTNLVLGVENRVNDKQLDSSCGKAVI
jgi:hypothetical protein